MAFNILNIGFDGTLASTFADRTNRVSEGDDNDIFYFLGTNYGTSSWSNPDGAGLLTLSGSEFGGNNWTDNTTTSSGYHNSTVFDHNFTFNNVIVNIERLDYFVYAPSASSADILQEVRLEVSLDNSTWIQVAVNSTDVLGDVNGGAGDWVSIFPNYEGYYPYMRIGFTKQIEFDGSLSFRLGEAKAYGTLKRTDGGEAGRVTPPTTLAGLPDVLIDTPQDGDYLYWNSGVVQHRREKLYRTSRQVMTGTVAPTAEVNNEEPNFYVLDPNGASRNFDLPNSPERNLYFRVRNLDNGFEINIRESAVTVATIGGAGGSGLTQADMWYDGTEWQIITM